MVVVEEGPHSMVILKLFYRHIDSVAIIFIWNAAGRELIIVIKVQTLLDLLPKGKNKPMLYII